MDGQTTPPQLPATVRAFEGTHAVLELSDGQTVRWPIKELPDDVTEGTYLRLVISTDATEAGDRQALARAVLNSLLQS